MLRRAARAGHELGNHTWSHPRVERLAPGELRDELIRTSDALERVTGVRPTRWRAPRFAATEAALGVAAELGLEHAGADVDPEDWRPEATAAGIVATVRLAAWDGAVVDLHDGIPPGETSARGDCTPTVEAVRELLRG